MTDKSSSMLRESSWVAMTDEEFKYVAREFKYFDLQWRNESY